MHTQDYIREFITIFFIRKRTIGAVMLAAVLMALAVSIFWPSSYRAEGTLIIKGSRTLESQGDIGNVENKLEPLREEDLFSEREILLSRDVIEASLSSLSGGGGTGTSSGETGQIKASAQRVRNGLSATVVPRSNIIEAEFVWHNAEEAELLLSTILDQYIQRRQNVFNPADAKSFFQGQLKLASDRLQNLEEELIEKTGGGSVSDIEDKLDANRALQSDLRRDLSRLETEHAGKAKRVEFLKESLKDKDYNLFTAFENIELGDLSERIMEIIAEREKQLRTYEPGSPPLQRSQEELDRVYGIFRAEAKRVQQNESQALSGIEAQMSDINRRLDQLEAEENKRYRDLLQARRLSRESAVMEDSYQAFSRRFRESTIRTETNSDSLFDVSIVQPAYAGATPVFPNPGKLIPLSLVLGLLLGLTLGFIMEFFDHRIRRPEDLRSNTDLGYLYSVPAYS